MTLNLIPALAGLAATIALGGTAGWWLRRLGEDRRRQEHEAHAREMTRAAGRARDRAVAEAAELERRLEQLRQRLESGRSAAGAERKEDARRLASIEKLEQRLAGGGDRIETLEQELAERNAELTEALATLSRTDDERARTDDTVRSARTHVAELETAQLRATATVSQLEGELERLRTEHDGCRAVAESMQTRCESLTKEVQRATRELERQRARSAEAANDASDRALATQQAHERRAAEQLQAAREQLEATEQRSAEAVGRATDLERKLHSTRGELAARTASLAALKTAADEASRRATKHERDAARLQRSVERMSEFLGPRELALAADPPGWILDREPEKPDPLTEINGIGAVLAERLNEIGIWRFEQLAQIDGEDLQWVAARLQISASRIERDRWIEQARALARAERSASREQAT